MLLEVAGLSNQQPPEAIHSHMALNPTTTTELYDCSHAPRLRLYVFAFSGQSHDTRS
jgi:hypothetical protein